MPYPIGPDNLRSIAIGVQHGWRRAVSSRLGRLGAFVPMIAISAAGLGVVLETSAAAFAIVKYLGAAYLPAGLRPPPGLRPFSPLPSITQLD